MTFGTAILTQPNARTIYGVRHDCGKFGQLTVMQIVKLTGMSRSSIQRRIAIGLTGEKLCDVPKANCRKRVRDNINRPVASVALRLALAFGNKVPTAKQIQSVRPMSESAAKRWRRVYREIVEAA